MKSHSAAKIAVYTSSILYFFYIFLANWNTSALQLGNTSLSAFFFSASNIVAIACCALVVYAIVRNTDNYIRNIPFTTTALLAMVLLLFTVKSLSIVLPILIGFAAIGVSHRAIAKLSAVSLSTLLAISSFFSILGLSGGNILSKPLFGDDSYYSITTNALGMANPNSVMLIAITIIALVLFLHNTKKYTLILSGLLIIAVIGLASITGSTTGMVLGLLTICLGSLCKYSGKLSRMVLKIAPYTFSLVTIITFIVGINYGPSSSLPNPVNDALTTRPYLWNLRIENRSYINLHGNKDAYTADYSKGGDAYALDNMTLYMLVHYGILVYIIFWFIFFKGSKLIKDSELSSYIIITTTLMLVERMYLYSIVMTFLIMSITTHYLNKKGDREWKIHQPYLK